MSRIKSKVYFIYHRLLARIKNLPKDPVIYDEAFCYNEYLMNLDIPKNRNIFIHAGLRGIKKVSGDEYYSVVSNIISAISDIYSPSSIIVPAFTPSFRSSGVYSKKYSIAEYGAFSEIFRSFSDYRTNDAIHSCSIISDDCSVFDKYDYTDTFGSNGLYSNLLDDTYVVNISTNHFVSTYLHCIEATLLCPYKKHNAIWRGVMFDRENNLIKKTQINHEYLYNCEINRKKLINSLIENKGIVIKKYKNLTVSSISIKKLDKIITDNIKNDPYFLVTF